MCSQQIEREIQSVGALYNFLVDDICNQIDGINSRFRSYIGIMGETGIPEEECTRFSNEFYAVDESNLKAIYNRIVDADLPQIQRYLEDLVRQFETATNSSYGNLSLHTPNPVSIQNPTEAIERNSNVHDYEVQINAICDFMGFLVEERNNLLKTIQTYQNYCNYMLENGVPIQLVNHYVANYATLNVNHINIKIVAHIQEDDYKQLMGLYVQIGESMRNIGLTPSRNPIAM